uniref:AP2/ERF transcription factor n=1 Tax=Camptotheca acuminata TaxID=16922 RepID=A0A7G8AUA6_CAMAC|nr:AP2/ERF transcription factor [Camptotheca acuminata]
MYFLFQTRPYLSTQQPLKQPHRPEKITDMEREPMFQKQLTQSDVGKLNRLVVPKQHAVNYFPVIDSGNERKIRTTLLSFEDELGKCWSFRYSYWSSSQSYVLTKGWSRFVKEKGLGVGDFVFFERHREDNDRFFIGCRWRASAGTGVTTQVQDNGVAHRVAMVDGSSEQSEKPPMGDSRRLRLFGVNVNLD